MRYRPLDENGEMMPIRNQDQMLYGSDAVSAAVDSRMKLCIGDWWEDESMGFQVPQFLIEGLRGDASAEMLMNYIIAYILQTQGVLMVNYANYTLKNRVFSANIGVDTIYGIGVERSVTMDELLRAIP